jgi:hypothetical protein
MYLILPLIALSGIYLFKRALVSPLKTPPPGPKPLPLLGNIRHLPPERTPDWLHWAKHKELHGIWPPQANLFAI